VAKAKPGELNFASAGYGTSQHLAGVMFNLMAGTKMAYITYKGAAATMPDLIGGRVQILFSGIPAALPHVKSGRLRALAVTSEKRSAGIADVPTVGENGLPGYSMTAWHGLLAPRNTPPRVIALLNKTVTEGIASREMRDLFIGMGLDPVGDSPGEHRAFISNEIRKISKVVKDADLKPE
jgi:tripartite-type tricarboxylate transporter receptor subunit TctC